jgi:hypothetical protein
MAGSLFGLALPLLIHSLRLWKSRAGKKLSHGLKAVSWSNVTECRRLEVTDLHRSHEDSRLHRIQRSVRPDDVGSGRLFSVMMRLAGPNATTPTASFVSG